MAIVSFKHNFIFLKTTKTAGTSIEVDLSQIAGDDAIVTPIIPPESGHTPRNFDDPDGEQPYYNHMTAAVMRKTLGPQRFDSMFKFCVEREPVSKCISQYHMLRNSPHHNADGAYNLSWAEFVREGRFPIDTRKFAIAGVKVVDQVLRYDELPFALENLMNDLGVSDFQLTARAKSDYSRKALVKPDMVKNWHKTTIKKRFAKSTKLSGIDWDTPAQIDESPQMARPDIQTP